MPSLSFWAGLNEGTWPERPAPDPWLNRKMRQAAGMLLPERQIGLSAHDYQQAVAAQEVVLSRAKRDAEAETVPSRWLNRLTNLLGGLPQQTVPKLFRRCGPPVTVTSLPRLPSIDLTIRQRLHRAPPLRRRYIRVPATSPSPKSSDLIRDPYAIYARHVLGLKALRPLDPMPDALLRGTVFHKHTGGILCPRCRFHRRFSGARAVPGDRSQMSCDLRALAIRPRALVWPPECDCGSVGRRRTGSPRSKATPSGSRSKESSIFLAPLSRCAARPTASTVQPPAHC